MRFLIVFTAFFLIYSPAVAQVYNGDRPILVELYTAQGCSSCPPADKLLIELNKEEDVLALSFHVDYWDRLGWRDPFASSEINGRQAKYADVYKLKSVYTPQMIVDGLAESTGASSDLVHKNIRAAWVDADDIPIEITGDSITQSLEVKIGGGKLYKEGQQPFDVWAFPYYSVRETDVKSGENKGKKLINHNVVKDIIHVGKWEHKDQTYYINKADVEGADFVAVVVQEPDMRRVRGLESAKPFIPPFQGPNDIERKEEAPEVAPEGSSTTSDKTEKASEQKQ